MNRYITLLLLGVLAAAMVLVLFVHMNSSYEQPGPEPAGVAGCAQDAALGNGNGGQDGAGAEAAEPAGLPGEVRDPAGIDSGAAPEASPDAAGSNAQAPSTGAATSAAAPAANGGNAQPAMLPTLIRWGSLPPL